MFYIQKQFKRTHVWKVSMCGEFLNLHALVFNLFQLKNNYLINIKLNINSYNRFFSLI